MSQWRGRRSHPHRLLVVGAAILTSTLALSGVAEAEFSAPVSISAAGQVAENAQVAADWDGDALIVWTRMDADELIKARARSADGVLGPIRALSTPGHAACCARVAVDPGGNALVVWSQQETDTTHNVNRIKARARSAAGVLGPIQTLSAAGLNAFDPQVAVDGDGDALVVWSSDTYSTPERVNARTRSADGVLGPTQVIAATGSGPQVAVDPGGDAIVVWTQWDGSGPRITARALSADGAMGPIQAISATGPDETYDEVAVQIAVDQDGDALVVWWQSEYDSTDQRVNARALSADGVLGPIQAVSTPGEVGGPSVGVDPAGDAVVVWTQWGRSGPRITARALSADGVLGPIHAISATGPDETYDYQVAVAPDGDAIVVWIQGEIDEAEQRVTARTLSSDGALGTIQALSAPGQYGRFPVLAVDGDGDALVVWYQEDKTGQRIMSASGP